MPVPLEPGDRKILIAAGAALLVLVLLAVRFAPVKPEPPFGIPSTYSTQAGGAKAAYLLLQELGYKEERWDRSPTELPEIAVHATLILAEPAVPSSAEEKLAIHRFLSSGGTVLGIGVLAPNMLPLGSAAAYESPGTAWRSIRPSVPSPLVKGVSEIVMAPTFRWTGAYGKPVAVFAEGENAVVVTYSWGKGRVIWWATATPLNNLGIRRADNLALLLNSIGPRDKTHVYWDEYFHGQRGGLWSYFAGTPIPWGLLQTGFVALALFLTFGRRSGPTRRLQVESRLAPLEFVETLGDLYHRAHAASAAVGIEYQRFRYLLSRRLGIPLSASITQVHVAVRERMGWKEPGFFEVLQRAERGVRDPTIGDKKRWPLCKRWSSTRICGSSSRGKRRRNTHGGTGSPCGGARPRRNGQEHRGPGGGHRSVVTGAALGRARAD